jgi:hypothetical protein
MYVTIDGTDPGIRYTSAGKRLHYEGRMYAPEGQAKDEAGIRELVEPWTAAGFGAVVVKQSSRYNVWISNSKP